MQIDIQAQNFKLTDSIRSYAERRLQFALSNCDEQILQIEMHLTNTNGMSGATEQHCLLRIMPLGLPEIVIEDIQKDIHIAIDRATDRGGRTVIRNIKRQESLLSHSDPSKKNQLHKKEG